jgi:hypothetical protein
MHTNAFLETMKEVTDRTMENRHDNTDCETLTAQRVHRMSEDFDLPQQLLLRQLLP